MVYDVVVIGAGLVGLAAAWRLLEARPGLRVAVLEKEDGEARHQSGRSSGVLHSGLYYAPGSLKARLCRDGKASMEAFCDEEGVAWRRTGKVVVACHPQEVPRLRALEARGVANGVVCRWIGPERLRELEPEAVGLAALEVPDAGVADLRGAAAALRRRLEGAGADVHLGAGVRAVRRTPGRLVLETAAGAVEGRVGLAAAGLHADRIARLAGARPTVRIVPFRGEYRSVVGPGAAMVRALLYPVPDPALPFLGVHLTRGVDGAVHAGPNAVPALAREGYRWTDVSCVDLAETLSWPGSWRMAARHGSAGVAELWRSLVPGAYGRAVRALVPAVQDAWLAPAPSGVRAQAVAPDGSLVHDFIVSEGPDLVHVLHAPSPAATACLAIGGVLREAVLARLG